MTSKVELYVRRKTIPTLLIRKATQFTRLKCQRHSKNKGNDCVAVKSAKKGFRKFELYVRRKTIRSCLIRQAPYFTRLKCQRHSKNKGNDCMDGKAVKKGFRKFKFILSMGISEKYVFLIYFCKSILYISNFKVFYYIFC